jgi:hypothetical protein
VKPRSTIIGRKAQTRTFLNFSFFAPTSIQSLDGFRVNVQYAWLRPKSVELAPPRAEWELLFELEAKLLRETIENMPLPFNT